MDTAPLYPDSPNYALAVRIGIARLEAYLRRHAAFDAWLRETGRA